jgi:hypothetical protein
MKKNLIITIALGFFLFSCKKSELLPVEKTGTTVAKSVSPTPPDFACLAYSIFNPAGPSGPAIIFYYKDCDGISQTGGVGPQQTVYIKAQPGSVKCLGGVVTQL